LHLHFIHHHHHHHRLIAHKSGTSQLINALYICCLHFVYLVVQGYIKLAMGTPSGYPSGICGILSAPLAVAKETPNSVSVISNLNLARSA
jgi:hypothetical protein